MLIQSYDLFLREHFECRFFHSCNFSRILTGSFSCLIEVSRVKELDELDRRRLNCAAITIFMLLF